MKKNLIKKLLDELTNSEDKNLEGFKAFDEGVTKLKNELRQKIQVNTLDDVNSELDKFKKNIDLSPLIESVEQIKRDIVSRETEVVGKIEERLQELRDELSNTRGTNKDNTNEIKEEIKLLTKKHKELSERKLPEFPDYLTPIKQSETRLNEVISIIQNDVKVIQNKDKTAELQKLIDDLDKSMIKLRTDLMSREKGGGGINRQIYIDGANPLTKYTDINLKEGTNVTLTYANNDTTKKVDVTISATGGGTVGPGTINEIAYFDTATSIASLPVATYPSLTELSYVKGVTSAIQTQLGGLVPYTGATSNVNLGIRSLVANKLSIESTTGEKAFFSGGEFVSGESGLYGGFSEIIGAYNEFDGYYKYGNGTIFVEYTGNVGIGTLTPSGKLDIQGIAVNDLPTYSAEFLLSTGWTSTDWTGDFATGWDHTTGNVTALSQSKAAVSGTKYQVSYTVTGRTAGTFSITFGGQSIATLSATGTWGPTATSTASLVITPTTTFDGTIVISIKSLTAVSTPLVNLKSSEGTARIEMRANNASSNTFIGNESGRYNTTGISNVGYGTSALRSNTTGTSNIAVGLSALQNNTVGSSNTAIGTSALQSNLTGTYNVALGTSALYSNTSGTTNIANGLQSLYTNTTGSSNVCIGVSAMYYNQSGANNTAIGYSALQNNTTGTNNVAIGINSGNFIADGTTVNATSDYGVYLGSAVRAGAYNNQNEIAIGYLAIGSGSNTATIGNSSVTDLYIPKTIHLQAFATAPASAAASGVAGTVIIQTDYIYVCSATNTWVRAALTTW